MNEPASFYMEMMEYKSSTRGHLIPLENKNAMKCYLEEFKNYTKIKQKAYETLASSAPKQWRSW